MRLTGALCATITHGAMVRVDVSVNIHAATAVIAIDTNRCRKDAYSNRPSIQKVWHNFWHPPCYCFRRPCCAAYWLRSKYNTESILILGGESDLNFCPSL